jgi:hypothetical protein
LRQKVAGDYSELQKSAHVFFPMSQFSYGLAYTIFATEFLDFEEVGLVVDKRYRQFAEGVSLFFAPRLLKEAQTFWKVETIDRDKTQPFRSDVPTLVLNGELKGSASSCPS